MIKIKSKIFKASLVISSTLIVLFITLSLIPYKDTKFSFREVSQLKFLRHYREIFHNKINPLTEYNLDEIRKLDIKSYEILIDEKEVNYFEKLWKNYDNNPNDSKLDDSLLGFDYYKKNRKWVKAKVVENNDTFSVKMRMHGIEPDGHYYGDYFSFHLKMNKKIYGVKKLKFIIGERIRFQADVLSFYSKKYNLVWAKPDEMVKVKINNLPERIFFKEGLYEDSLERPFKDTPIYYYKSGFQAMKAPVANLINLLKKDSVNSEFKTRLLEINQAIQKGNSKKLLSFFDKDYLTKYFIVKTILGFSGHECYPGNWYVFYNEKDSLFYPSISREPTFMNLNQGDLKNILTHYNHPLKARSNIGLPFYEVILNNDEFFHHYKTKLLNTVQSDRKEIISNWENSKENYSKLIKGDYLYKLLNIDKTLINIKDNLDYIESTYK